MAAGDDEAAGWLRGVVVVGCRGAAVGAGLHAGTGLLAGMASRRLLQRPLHYLIGLVNSDMVRFASFVGLASSTYKLITALLKQYCKEERRWQAVVAGLAAGLTSLVDDPNRRRTLSFFVSARALGALVSTLHRQGYLPTVPHFVLLLLGLCQSFIILAMTRFPELLPQSYYRTILRWSLYYSEEKLQVYFRHPHPNFIPCNVLMHEGSCLECAVKDFYGTFYLFLKIYFTVYSMPLLLFRTKRLLTAPKESLRTLLKNTCVSSLFFAVDATLIKYGLCLLRNAWGRPPPTPALIPILAGAMGVVGMLIERKSRRLEMLYYGLPQIFYGVWRLLCIKKPLGLHRIPLGSVLLLSLSLAAIMHAFEWEKQSISPLVNRSLQFLLRDSGYQT